MNSSSLAIAASTVAAVLLSAATPPQANGQGVSLPLPRLLTVVPMGGRVGSEVEVSVTGQNIEGASELLFTHPGLTATAKTADDGTAIENTFVVRIAEDCPPGLHEAHLLTRMGISSSRVFCVGDLPEVTCGQSNTVADQAMSLEVGSTCNASLTAKAIDHYRFSADEGKRILIRCEAAGIESKANAVVSVSDSQGRTLASERRSGTIDFTAPATGEYLIKVHDLTFNGGAEYYYRLTLKELAGDAEVALAESVRHVRAFSWPPSGVAPEAAVQESEPNDTADQAQRIELPCDIAGRFYPAADVDTFEFEAKKGDVWWLEVASERLGVETHPAAVIQHVRRDGDAEKLTDVAEFTEVASPIKPSSNGYAYDGPPYDGGTADILGSFEINEDGLHRLQINDLFGGTRDDPNSHYRLIIRRPAPDFAVAAWRLHMELRNGDRNALSKPLALRVGETAALEVAAFRRDGFDGAIELAAEGLPDGVTAVGLTIPPGNNRGIILVTADVESPESHAWASFHGTAEIDGEAITREGRLASMSWPVPDAWSETPRPRLVGAMPVSVTQAEVFPLRIAPREAMHEAVEGEKLTIPLSIEARSEFSGSVLQLRTFGAGFEQTPRFDVSLTSDSAEAVLDLAALKTPPGEYVIAFYGPAVVKYSADGETTKDLAEIMVSEPVTIRVKPKTSGTQGAESE